METVQLTNLDYQGYYNKTRHACRGVILKDGNILLSHEGKTNVYLLPGGGVEESESFMQCCEREILEETGITCTANNHYLDIDELFGTFRHINHYFICDILHTGGEVHLTPREVEYKVTSKWLPLKEAIRIFSVYNDYKETDVSIYGLYRREYEALQKLKGLKDF